MLRRMKALFHWRRPLDPNVHLPGLLPPKMLCSCGAIREIAGRVVDNSLPLEKHTMYRCDLWHASTRS